MRQEDYDGLMYTTIEWDAETGRYEIVTKPIVKKENDTVKKWTENLKNWWKKIELKWKEFAHGHDDAGTPGTTGNVVNTGTSEPGAGANSTPIVIGGDPAVGTVTTGDTPNETGGAKEPNSFGDAELLDEYRNLNLDQFYAEGMFPDFEDVAECTRVLPTQMTRGDRPALNWDSALVTPSFVYPANEELKVVQVWFRNGKALLFKDWGAQNPPYTDSRWYRNNDLRRTGAEYDARTTGNKLLVMLVTTLQPQGLNDIARVIARSEVITW